MFRSTRPKRLRIEASSACNLRCPSCPTTTGHIHPAVGTGVLTIENFRRLLDQNPCVEKIELSNYGEVFLNPNLVAILRTAYERNVRITLNNGVNLNRCSEAMLEALVKYGVWSMTCSIDGASQETYEVYRVRGSFDRVLAHIDIINKHKRRLGRSKPTLCWQFVVMGHNQHEIAKARHMATERGMEFKPKLTWDDGFSPLRDAEAVRKILGHPPTRDAWVEEYGKTFGEDVCLQLWQQPQVNWDGKLLGCCFNFWGDFGGNVFEQGLESALDSGKMVRAKQMLHGTLPPDPDIPCATCSKYYARRQHGRWISKWRVGFEELRSTRAASRIRRTRLWRDFLQPIWRSLVNPY